MRSSRILIVILGMFLVFTGVVNSATIVEVTKPELKSIELIEKVTGKIIPFQSIDLAAKNGGVITEVKVDVGDKVIKGQELILFEQEQYKAQVKQAEAALARARASLAQTRKGAREEDIELLKLRYEQAKTSLTGAESNLKFLETMYKDRLTQKQQLTSAEIQLQSAEMQMAQVEENFRQAKINLEQAEKEYKRIEYLFKQDVVSEKQYEMAKNQLDNARIGFKNTELAVKQSKISYEGAKKNYQLVEKMFNDPTQLEQQLEGARNQLEIAKVNVKIAKTNLDKALEGATEEQIISSEAGVKQAEAQLEMARLRLKDTVIKSPISGVVAMVGVDRGEMTGPGTPIAKIIETDKVYATANLTARLTSILQPEERVEVEIESLGNRVYTGVIDLISPAADERTQSYPVKILINNNNGDIRPGMFCEINFVTNRSEGSLVIPVSAVLDLENSPYVYKVEGDRAVKVSVETGIIKGNEIEITAGLSPEDQIIIRGQNFLKPGEKVEVVGS